VKAGQVVGWVEAWQAKDCLVRTLQLLAELALLVAELAVVSLQVGAVLQQAGGGALGVAQRRLCHLKLTQRAAELAGVGLALAAGGPAGSAHIKQTDEKQNKLKLDRAARLGCAPHLLSANGISCPDPPEPLGIRLGCALPVLRRLQPALQLQHLQAADTQYSMAQHTRCSAADNYNH
jgi:hypothetical protein